MNPDPSPTDEIEVVPPARPTPHDDYPSTMQIQCLKCGGMQTLTLVYWKLEALGEVVGWRCDRCHEPTYTAYVTAEGVKVRDALKHAQRALRKRPRHKGRQARFDVLLQAMEIHTLDEIPPEALDALVL